MDHAARRQLMVIGTALALIGVLLVSAAYVVEHTPYTPAPGCESMACPSHPDFFGLFWAEDVLLDGFAIILVGAGIALTAAAIPGPLTEAEKVAILERIERVRRRID